MRNLIVYFSRADENYYNGKIVSLKTGNNEVLKDMLKTLIKADVFRIEMVKPYSKNYQKCIEEAKRHLYRNIKPEIIPFNLDINDYENIYLIYPNYWSTMPMALWTFFDEVDLSNKNIFPICTHEGSGLGNSESDLKKVLKNSIIHNGLAVKGSFVNMAKEQLKRYLQL